MALGATLAPGGTANAANPAGFALADCNQAGDQFVLSDGKSKAEDWTVEAVDSAGQAVATLTAVNAAPERDSQWIYRSYSVPAGTVYDSVRFTNKATGASDLVKPVTENCTQAAVKLTTGDPGPGLVPIPPVRAIDTRAILVSEPPRLDVPVSAGGTIEVQVTGRDGIPSDAGAVQLNIAAVQPAGVGHVRVFPCGTPRPLTSNLNYIQGETRAANVFVKPGATGSVCLYTSTTTHLLVDIQGYVAAKSAPVAIKPVRVADTRPGEPVDGPGLLPKNKATEVRLDMAKLASFSDVPADASGYVVNITATNASTVGYLQQCSDPRTGPPNSVLNFIPGRAVSNLALTNFGDELCLQASSAVDLIVDVVGYTKAYESPQTLSNGVRLLDTRPDQPGAGTGTDDYKHSGVGRIAADSVYTLDVAGRSDGFVPTNMAAAVVTITGVRPSANGHITAYDCGQKPKTSNLNIRPGEATANLSVVPVSADGKICLYSSVATDLLVDIGGFVPSDNTPMRAGPIELSQNTPAAKFEVTGGKAPYTLTGDLPQSLTLKMDAAGTVTYTGDPTTLTHYAGTITVSDAKGQQISMRVAIAWYPASADVWSRIPPRT